MDLHLIQPWVATLIRAGTIVNAMGDLSGVASMTNKRSVIEDDGTYPKTPHREDLLSRKGICITVWGLEVAGLGDGSRAGALAAELYVPVVVEENVKINRASGGTGIFAERVVQAVLESTLGERYTPTSNNVLTAFDPPWNNLGLINGTHRTVINLRLTNVIAHA